MASTDATPLPIKNQAYRITFPIYDADGDLVSAAAALDSEVSKDGAAFSDATAEATEIATNSGVYYLDLTAGEMNADTVAVIVKTTTTGAKTTVVVLYPQDSTDTDATADALLDRADAIETSLTIRKALRLCAAEAGGKVSGGPNAPVFLGAGVATTRITGTCDVNGNRTAITLNL